MIVSWLVALLFLILSMVFMMGKGAFLIAGYNTASENEKAKYDEKKLCHVMGLGMLCISFGLVILSINIEWIGLFFIFFTIGLFICLYGTNRWCKKEGIIEGKEEKDPAANLIRNGSFILVILSFLGIGWMLYSGDIFLELNKDSMRITGFMSNDSVVEYKDITKVELMDSLQESKRTAGFGGLKVSTGHFKNDEMGVYKRYTYNDCDTYILIKTKDQSIVLNAENEKMTKQWAVDIKERM